jgi:hypothetical protein
MFHSIVNFNDSVLLNNKHPAVVGVGNFYGCCKSGGKFFQINALSIKNKEEKIPAQKSSFFIIF